jgi:F0F1-type ATP synthase assembly protein I
MSADPPDNPGRQGESDAWAAFSLIIAGVVFWGGIGWLVSEWLDQRVFVMLGLLLGMGGGLYLVWFRYGRS